MIEKWFVLAVSVKNNGSVGEIEVELREAESDWTTFSNTGDLLTFDGGEDAFVSIGQYLNGIVNSFEMKVHDGNSQIDQNVAIGESFISFIFFKIVMRPVWKTVYVLEFNL